MDDTTHYYKSLTDSLVLSVIWLYLGTLFKGLICWHCMIDLIWLTSFNMAYSNHSFLLNFLSSAWVSVLALVPLLAVGVIILSHLWSLGKVPQSGTRGNIILFLQSLLTCVKVHSKNFYCSIEIYADRYSLNVLWSGKVSGLLQLCWRFRLRGF